MTTLESFLLSLNNIPKKEYMKDARMCGVYLERLQFFLNILGNPEQRIPHYIHVTGTSGKGSVCAYLTAVLQQAGFRVGEFTSPHISSFSERFLVNGKPMTKAEEQKVEQKIRAGLDIYIRTAPYDMLSFFEITTAISLLHFANKKVDYAVMEVGCGGRYDSTNIIPHKDVAIITNIGLDHVGLIGNNKAEIAYEKAGIIKPGCIVFTGERQPNIRRIITKEARLSSVVCTYVEPIFDIVKQTKDSTTFSFEHKTYSIPSVSAAQMHNASLAIKALEHINIPYRTINAGLRRAQLPVRMEQLSKHPLTIIDGAHNEDKIHSTIETTKRLIALHDIKRVHLVFGLSCDKQLTPIIKDLLSLPITSIACTRALNIPAYKSVHPPQAIAQAVRQTKRQITTELFLDPTDAYAWSVQQSSKHDMILTTGSMFLAAEIRSHILGAQK